MLLLKDNDINLKYPVCKKKETRVKHKGAQKETDMIFHFQICAHGCLMKIYNVNCGPTLTTKDRWAGNSKNSGANQPRERA